MTEPLESTTGQNPLTRPRFIIPAVIVAVLIIAAIVLAIIPKGGGTAAPEGTGPTDSVATASTPNPASTAAPASASAQSEASICGLPAGTQTTPVTTPEGTKWELVGKIATPTSPKKYGPGRTGSNGLRSCFAHSPTGALYAGMNMVVLSSTGHSNLVTKYLTVDGPERDKLLAAPGSASIGDPDFQLAGFRISDYSGSRAVIDYGFKVSNGTFGSIPVAMQWQDGDWKFIPPASGQNEGRQISDLNGFIPWTGV
ncbi:hypothetical protein IV498_14680 [Paenarthrobacter sp. Z7-10]|uniref:hypothetical protein n=1 Tax=Paenarthrobacter sp. Z7-10 TaxID=2787635 RepID=UPI0022A913AD|nr:hypothetical protein [Paenarthrobacter sp. Z7-10]MCZ2404388.1 hypothetical protein [Paenarthrobacter sp. Z7-10]